LASLGAFLVIEAREHAEKRGVKALGRLTSVVSDRASRRPGTVTKTLTRLWDGLKAGVDPNRTAVLSGATGANPATEEERNFFEAHRDLVVRATGSYLGHGLEPQFAMNIALATIALDRGSLFPPCDPTGLEQPMNRELRQVVVTGVGHWRGEGLALVERAG
jgi:3-oxoacyl-[acyl-carrier-protein] synthase II